MRKVPREQALSLDQEKADALLSYTEATPELDSAGGLLASDAKAKRPPTEAERAQAKNDAALVKALRTALRDAGIERAQIALTQDHGRMHLTRAQAERLARERSSRAGK